MKILYAASEAQPVAASGGLADVAGSVTKAMAKAGNIDCRVIAQKPKMAPYIEQMRINIAKLCGVEIIEDAVVNARKNAKLNQRSEENTLFVCGDASVGVKKCRECFGNPEIIIVDPPRKGLDIEVINTVVSASPERVIYISCDPATLARDCAELEKRGYKAQEATPFDLFPRTGHVESVVCLVRRD